MKVLVIGSGGREHAIAWKLAQSERVETVYVAPGNGGTAREPKCRNVPVPGGDPSTSAAQAALVEFAAGAGIAFVVVGPEAPLAAGLVDRLRAAGIPAVGPDARGARLEASKAFSKDFMERHGVRAAKSRTVRDYDAARAIAAAHFASDAVPDGASALAPLVVKADGLAAGKGVVVAESFAQADEALRAFMADGALGDAGRTVVLEDFLRGVEVSVLAAVSVSAGSGARAAIVPFVAARDHKRRFEGGRGPNTGGMGAIAPVPDFGFAAQEDFRAAILEPTLRGLQAEGFDYRGFIFFGLMVDGDRCSLLEYNVRLGDPETQAVLPLLEMDMVDLCAAILDGTLDALPLRWKSGACCAPVAVADGYPNAYRRGDPIELDEAALAAVGAKAFIAGAVPEAAPRPETPPTPSGASVPRLATSGGRVLAVSAVAPNADEARRRAYAGMAAVHFAGMGFRTDIGARS
jgi:phosphoribosylamine--glycine ligase